SGLEALSLSTQDGDICGTPEYIAPEQARGEPLDRRADLYSIAVILYHAVVGRPPFSGGSPLATVSLHLSPPPPPPGEVRPDLAISPPLERLLLRGLAKDRADRPSSAEVFRADLLQIDRDYARRDRRASSAWPAAAATLPGPATVRRRQRLRLLATGV